jgi:hypothetical protein
MLIVCTHDVPMAFVLALLSLSQMFDRGGFYLLWCVQHVCFTFLLRTHPLPASCAWCPQ